MNKWMGFRKPCVSALMASRPSYNPNKFGETAPEIWKNKGVSFIYEPGSTFKAVVAAAALQEKTVSPNQVFVDPGYVMVSGRRIQNWNGESFGTVTFTDVVKNSLNTGFAQVGLELGAERLTKYAKLFGFGTPTGVELPAEEQGILFDPAQMRASDVATMYERNARRRTRRAAALGVLFRRKVRGAMHLLKWLYPGMDRILRSQKVYNPEEDGVVYFPIGDNERDPYRRGIDATDGSQVVDYGNYGVLYHIQIPTVSSYATQYYLSPLGGVYAGAM